MKEVIIKYKDSKTLMLLKDLAKYFDFTISKPKKGISKTETTETQIINGVTLIRGKRSFDTSGEEGIFTGRNIDAKKLRQEAWKRGK